MKKLFFGLLFSLFLIQNAYSAVPYTAVDGTVAFAADYNSNETYFENKFSTTSGHDHDNSDSKLLTTLSTITSGEWRGTVVGQTYGGTGLSSYSTGDMVGATADGVLAKILGASSDNVLHSITNGLPVWKKVNLATEITGELNASLIGNGTVGTARLGSGTANSSTYLRGDQSWQTPPSLSNVIYCWLDSDVGTTNVFGMVEGTSLTPTMSTYTVNYHFFGVYGLTYRTILTGRFVKIAGISTVTIHARIWTSDPTSGRLAYLSADIGGQSNSVNILSNTPSWVTTSTIDVSSLTNGTGYDITIQLKNENSGASAYCSGIILTAS